MMTRAYLYAKGRSPRVYVSSDAVSVKNYTRVVQFFDAYAEYLRDIDAIIIAPAKMFQEEWKGYFIRTINDPAKGIGIDLYVLPNGKKVSVVSMRHSFHGEILAKNIAVLVEKYPAIKEVYFYQTAGYLGHFQGHHAVYPKGVLLPSGKEVPNSLHAKGGDDFLHSSVVSVLEETPGLITESLQKGVKTLDMELGYLAGELDKTKVKLGFGLVIVDAVTLEDGAENTGGWGDSYLAKNEKSFPLQVVEHLGGAGERAMTEAEFWAQIQRQRDFSDRLVATIKKPLAQSLYAGVDMKDIHGVDISSFSRGTNIEGSDIDLIFLGLPEDKAIGWKWGDNGDRSDERRIESLDELRQVSPLYANLMDDLKAAFKEGKIGEINFVRVKAWKALPSILVHFTFESSQFGKQHLSMILMHPQAYFGIKHGLGFDSLLKRTIDKYGKERAAQIVRDIRILKKLVADELTDTDAVPEAGVKVPGFAIESFFWGENARPRSLEDILGVVSELNIEPSEFDRKSEVWVEQKSMLLGGDKSIKQVIQESMTFNEYKKLRLIARSWVKQNGADMAQSANMIPGGIDLNAEGFNLGSKAVGGGIELHMDSAILSRYRNVSGFTPVIFNIQPMENLKVFLSLPS